MKREEGSALACQDSETLHDVALAAWRLWQVMAVITRTRKVLVGCVGV